MRNRRLPSWPRLPLAAAASVLALLGSAPAAAVDKAAFGAEAVTACEQAARQSLGPQAQLADLTFSPPPTMQEGLSSDSQVVLRGAGRWRAAGGARSFTYSCNVDVRTAKAVGMVIRDAAPVAAPAAPARMPTEPDLSALSPTACESSAVQALKKRWPRIGQIRFDDATRRFAAEDAEPRRAARLRPRAAGAGGAADALRLRVRDRHARRPRRRHAHLGLSAAALPAATRAASGRGDRPQPASAYLIEQP